VNREDADRIKGRTREDIEFNKRLNQELADASKRGATPADLTDINQRAMRERQQLEERRRYENEDVAVARQRQAQDLDLQRNREKEDVENGKALRDKQHDFERGQQLKLDQFQRQLAAERTAFEDQQADLRAAHQVRLIIATQDRQIHEQETAYEKIRRTEQEHYNQIENDVLRPAFLRQLQLYEELFIQPAAELYAGIYDQEGLLVGFGAGVGAASAANGGAGGTSTATEPSTVRLDDDQVDDLVQGLADANAQRPTILDGDSVDQSLAHVRANRSRNRVL
jgi:hypothetical protein